MTRWLPVVGYEGRYEVSDDGQVRSVDREVVQADRWGKQTRRRLKGVLLKPGKHGPNPRGQCRRFVMLGKQNPKLVHRLVLEAFVGPPPPGCTDGSHLNDNPEDNRLENLVWDTRAGNKVTAVENGINPNARKTHCKQGHPFDESNTIHRISVNGRPRRDCRACQQEALRRFHANNPDKQREYHATYAAKRRASS